MIKEEKINRKKALMRVRSNVELLSKKENNLKTVYDIIFSKPNYTFLNVVNSYGYDEITYGKAQAHNQCFAHYFISNIHTKYKYVGLLLDNSKEWIFSFFGLLLAGFCPVLLSTANDYSEIETVLKRLKFDYIVTDKNVSIPGVNLINPFDIKYSEQPAPDCEFADEIVFLSSGTSGEPKIVFYTGKQLSNQINNAKDILENDKNFAKCYKGYFKHLVILPFYHIFGLFAVLLWFSFFNVCFILPTSLSPKAIKQACSLCKPTHIFAVPLFWENLTALIKAKVDTEKKQKQLAKAFKTSESLQRRFGSFGTYLVREKMFKKYLNEIFGTSIRFCISGGAFLSEETLRTINLLGYPLMNGYGSTEIGIVSLCESNSLDKRLSLSIGRPFKNVDYKIENGVLMIHAPSSSRCILESGKEIVLGENDWVNTCDLVEEKDGNIYLLGREDEIIIQSDGENLSLPIIEKSLSLPKANEFALVCDGGKISLIASYSRITPINAVIDELNAINDKHISNIYYTNIALPKANSLKIKRNALKQLLLSNKDSFIPLKELKNKSELSDTIVNNEIMEIVTSSFKNLFPELEVNPDSNFYTELGGDSLKYFVLVSLIEEKLNKELVIDYNNPPVTPAGFVELIEKTLL